MLMSCDRAGCCKSSRRRGHQRRVACCCSVLPCAAVELLSSNYQPTGLCSVPARHEMLPQSCDLMPSNTSSSAVSADMLEGTLAHTKPSSVVLPQGECNEADAACVCLLDTTPSIVGLPCVSRPQPQSPRCAKGGLLPHAHLATPWMLPTMCVYKSVKISVSWGKKC